MREVIETRRTEPRCATQNDVADRAAVQARTESEEPGELDVLVVRDDVWRPRQRDEFGARVERIMQMHEIEPV